MAKIISIHSFRGGTGKSNITANLAVCAAMHGTNVGIVDTDIQSPGIHVIFGMDDITPRHSLNDYLWGRCSVEEATHVVTPREVADQGGSIRLIPSSIKTGEITRILREGYDVGLLNEGFHEVIERFGLDYLLIDTHPGLNEETLLSIAISDALLVILRPDRQDLQGTAVTLEVARKLEVPITRLLVNRMTRTADPKAIKEKMEATFSVPVIGTFSDTEEMLQLGSAGVFSLEYPAHPFTDGLYDLTASVMRMVQ
jgi:MinD-like ATPase involved in chromosome partitioning or flagellar assembly